jgi:hypothetical protein
MRVRRWAVKRIHDAAQGAVHDGKPTSEKGGRAVRRFALLVAGGAVWLFLLALPALADGGPHIKGQYGNTPAECAGCHRAHSAALKIWGDCGICTLDNSF